MLCNIGFQYILINLFTLPGFGIGYKSHEPVSRRSFNYLVSVVRLISNTTIKQKCHQINHSLSFYFYNFFTVCPFWNRDVHSMTLYEVELTDLQPDYNYNSYLTEPILVYTDT